MRRTLPLAVRVVAPRQSGLLVAGAGLGLIALGLRHAWKTFLVPQGAAHTAPAGFVPHPGSRDPHTANLSKVFYEGGFEDKMSKAEAARILGVRESANRERILERYRTLMKINHPDRGGSPMLSLKVNEAKEILARSSKDEKSDKASRRPPPRS